MKVLSKRLKVLEAHKALNAGYWITLKSDPRLGQTSDSVIADYEAAHGPDENRHFIVWNLVDPKGQEDAN